MYGWLKFAHILSILMLSVGSLGSLLVAIRARRTGSVREIVTLMRTHGFTVKAGIIPGAMGSLLTGVALVHHLGIEWRSTWIVGSLAAWIASLLLGVALLLPAEARSLREGDRLIAEGVDAPTADLVRSVGAPAIYLGEWATVVLVVVITYLMIFKPA